MSLQPMWFLDYMMQGSTEFLMPSDDGESVKRSKDGALYRKWFREATRIYNNYEFFSYDHALDLQSIGPQRVPFGMAYIETSYKNGMRVATLASAYSEENEVGYLTFLKRPRHKYVLTLLSQGYLDDAGAMVHLDIGGNRVRSRLQETGWEDATNWDVWAVDALNVIGLMNCKNVGMDRHARGVAKPRSSSRKLRRATPKLDFHTISLPGEIHSGGGLKGPSVGEVAKHKVRGHFATYTEDAPLFGKHVGTYWKPWHIRGNAAHGITVTDYKVGTPAVTEMSNA